MELTIEQALQQGVTAHKEGKLQDAEKLYRAILQSQPLHPDANHNLGLLAVSVNKADAALPLFKTALEANPKIEQFWLSYADALIREEQFENAKQVIEQAKTQGVAGGKLIDLEMQIKLRAQVNGPKLAVQEKSLSLLEKRKKLAEQKKQKKAREKHLKANNPSQQQISNLFEHYQNGRFSDAEKMAKTMTQEFPQHGFAWKALGVVLQATGRMSEALGANQTAVTLSPQDATARNNLGVTLQDSGKLDEAEASYAQAIALKPDYAEAHCNLGNTLKERRRFDEAEASYIQAIALKPDLAEAHYHLGNTVQELGRLDEAEACYTRAIALKPDYAEAKHILAALSGETTESAPRDYVEKLFDIYAAKFESSLVENLEYKIPRVIAEMIMNDSKCDLLGSIMDLGCGTGLFGVEIKQFCEHLEGIDLSEKMLDEAKKKDIYNKLIKEDILAYLSNASLNFDYFVSTDVFVYIGDLSDVFRLIKSRNKKAGKLAFSTENYDGDGFFLERSGRYSHSKKYIESLCKAFGYEMRHFETQALRKDKNRYISGGLYLLDF